MNETLLALTIAYMLFTALLLLALIQSRLHWHLKSGLLVLALLFYWLSYQGWREAQGWPSATEIPERFLLHFAVIEEPDKEIGTVGNIYVWLSNLEDHELGGSPRAYRLDYSQAVHTKLQDALNRMRNGKIQLGSLSRGGDEVLDGLLGSRSVEIDDALQLFDLPDPALPEK